MSQVLVTVGIPLYNHEKFIVECLKSIVEQNYSNIELIVIDDGSPDDSFQVAKTYLDSQTQLKNYRIITRGNKGMCNTLNEIIELANGEYISLTGSDDYWKPDKISDQAKFLEQHPEISLVHSNSVIIDNNGVEGKVIDYSGKVNSGNIYEAFIYRKGGINTPSIMLRSSVYEDIGGYDSSFSFEDTDFFLRLTKEHLIGFINKVHTYYRRHGGNISHSNNKLKFFYDELLGIYEKNVDNPKYKRYLVLRIYKKSAEAALKNADFKSFLIHLGKYWRLKLFK